MRRSSGFIAGVAFMLSGSLAFAGETATSLMMAGMPSECAEYASNVSRSEGGWKSVGNVNGVSCYGAFQFCSAKGSPIGGTFSQYYNGTPEQFLNDPAAQVAAWQAYEKDSWAQAQRNGLTSAIGQQVCYQGQCATLTQSSLLKACQFGCGKGGKLDNFVKGGFNCEAPGTKDGAGTSVCKYLIGGSGFDVSCVTSQNDGLNCLPGATKP